MSGSNFVRFVMDQLAELPGGVRARAMFGAHGLYCGAYFFAIVANERVYFKTDDASRAAYVARGMGPFQISDSVALKSYWEVPLEVLEQRRLAVEWALAAVAVAEVSPSAARRGKKKLLSRQQSAVQPARRKGAPRKKRGR